MITTFLWYHSFFILLTIFHHIFCFCEVHTTSVLDCAHVCMKCSLGVSKFLGKISSLSYSSVSSIFSICIKHAQCYIPIQCLSSDMLHMFFFFNPLQKKLMWQLITIHIFCIVICFEPPPLPPGKTHPINYHSLMLCYYMLEVSFSLIESNTPCSLPLSSVPVLWHTSCTSLSSPNKIWSVAYHNYCFGSVMSFKFFFNSF